MKITELNIKNEKNHANPPIIKFLDLNLSNILKTILKILLSFLAWSGVIALNILKNYLLGYFLCKVSKL